MELVMFLFLRMVPFLSFQTDWKKNAQITKLCMKHFYLAWNSYNPWAWNRLKLLGILSGGAASIQGMPML